MILIQKVWDDIKELANFPAIPNNSNIGWSRDTLRNSVCSFLTSGSYCESIADRTSERFECFLKEIRMPINTKLLCSPVLCPRHWREWKSLLSASKGSPESPLCLQPVTKGFPTQLYFVPGSNLLEAKLVWLWTSRHEMKAFFSAVIEDALMLESCRLAMLWRRLGEKWTCRKLARLCGGREADTLHSTEFKHPVPL